MDKEQRQAKFIQAMKDIIGRYNFRPNYAPGRFSLALTLTGKRINGKVAFTNEAY